MFLFAKSRFPMVWALATIGMSVGIVVSAADYFAPGPTPLFLLEKGVLRDHPLWRTAFNFHVAGSCVCFAVGPLLMVSRLLRSTTWRGRQVHSVLGYVYLNVVLWIAAPMGLIISPAAKTGIWAAAGFLLTGALWWLATWFGYRAIVIGETRAHICWMVRSYSIALGAIWFRVIHVGLAYLLDNDTNYIASVWLSLLVSVWMSELCILRHFPDQRILRWPNFTLSKLPQGEI